MDRDGAVGRHFLGRRSLGVVWFRLDHVRRDRTLVHGSPHLLVDHQHRHDDDLDNHHDDIAARHTEWSGGTRGARRRDGPGHPEGRHH